MSTAVNTKIWFISVSTTFLARGFIFATWISRGPEVKELLRLNNAQMGLFTMLSALGGLLIILYSGRIASRYGSRNVSVISFSVMAISFLLLGLAIQGNLLGPAALLLLIFGAPIAMIDFTGNLEANALNQNAAKSRMQSIHSAYSVGMLVGSGLSSLLIGFGTSLATHFTFIALVMGASAIIASAQIPDHGHHAKAESKEEIAHAKYMRKAVWTERRSLLITLVGFSFILSEMAAGTWAPIALTDAGYSNSAGAIAITAFWVAILLGRLSGDAMINRFGRVRSVQISLFVTIAGVTIFAASDFLHIPFVGLFLWGLGMSNGFPMMISAMGDDLKWATPRVNMIISMVYVSALTAGPALGAVGQFVGLYAAFGVPLLFLIIATFFTKIATPLKTN
jgi:fucose permease